MNRRQRHRGRRSTPAGGHRPVLLREALAVLDPRLGAIAVDCTLGLGGHAAELLRHIGPEGRLIGLDLDLANLEPVRNLLASVGPNFELHHLNFAGLWPLMERRGLRADLVLADLGMSSVQVDDPQRGFSLLRDGPLDMRMDPTRGRTAAELVATLPAEQLAEAFHEFGDEPQAQRIAEAIVERRRTRPLARTVELTELIQKAAPVPAVRGPGQPTARQQRLRPAARVFQALRILVNREMANLDELLRTLPEILKPGGRAAIITFHSGEDRRVKQAFRDGQRAGLYEDIGDEPLRAGEIERHENPRSRSAKLRWVRRAAGPGVAERT